MPRAVNPTGLPETVGEGPPGGAEAGPERHRMTSQGLALVRGRRAATAGVANSLPDPPGQMGYCLPPPPPRSHSPETQRG